MLSSCCLPRPGRHHRTQAISRSRFWGTPIPIWASEDGDEVVVVGSKEELEALTGEKVGGRPARPSPAH